MEMKHIYMDCWLYMILDWIFKSQEKKAILEKENQWLSGQALWHQEKLVKRKHILKCALSLPQPAAFLAWPSLNRLQAWSNMCFLGD
jgi:hypothetical protein